VIGQSGIPPPPICSINPSDCGVLYASSANYYSSYSAAGLDGLITLSLAPSATAFTEVHQGTTSTTFFGSVASAALPTLTVESTTYTGSIVASNSPTRTLYVITIGGVPYHLADGSYVVAETFTDIESSIPTPACDPPRTVPLFSTCGQCTIYGDNVQLLYFPPTSTSRDMCATTPAPPTNCPLGPLTAPYTPGTPYVTEGFTGCENVAPCPYLMMRTTTSDSGPYIVSGSSTYYENRAYLSLDLAYASDLCDYVGARHSGHLFTMASSEIYSIPGQKVRQASICADAGIPFNFADLLPNVPQSAWIQSYEPFGCIAPINIPGPCEFDILPRVSRRR
jgi:hypothetical protein